MSLLFAKAIEVINSVAPRHFFKQVLTDNCCAEKNNLAMQTSSKFKQDYATYTLKFNTVYISCTLLYVYI